MNGANKTKKKTFITLRKNDVWGANHIETLNNVLLRLSEQIGTLNTNVEGIKTELLQKYEDVLTVANNAKLLAESIQSEMVTIQRECATVKSENSMLKKQVNYLDNYGRRSNLVIGGIPEQDRERCDNVVRLFLKRQLQLDSDEVDAMKFERVHRLWKKGESAGRTRPIIVRFYDYGERQKVWGSRSKLRGTSYSLNENFCADTEFNRRRLYPIYRKAKNMGKYQQIVSMRMDVLVIDSKEYTVDNICDLPNDLNPMNLCETQNEDCIVFGGMYSEYTCFSNWSASNFTFKNNKFVCLEQSYMFHKATINNDHDKAQQIMNTDKAREIKNIGSAIRVERNSNWHNVKNKLMLELVRAKFNQNEEMKAKLIATGNRNIGESGRDMNFAIGLPLTHSDVLDSTKWTGNNELGKALKIVRQELIDF